MPPTAAPLKALVVEDDAQTRFAVAAILHRQGFEVATHPGPMADVLLAVARERPKVVVVDAALTGVAGLGAVSSIRDAAPGAAIIVLSPLHGLRQAALRAGAAAVIAPADLRRLAACLQEVASAAAAHCDCCRGPVAECTSSPALGEGSLRIAPGPSIAVRVDHPGSLSSGGGQSSASQAGGDCPGE